MYISFENIIIDNAHVACVTSVPLCFPSNKMALEFLLDSGKSLKLPFELSYDDCSRVIEIIHDHLLMGGGILEINIDSKGLVDYEFVPEAKRTTTKK